jgi:DNA-binding MarR family transcriptional regulator
MEQNERREQIGDLAVAILRTVPLLYRRVIRKNEKLEGNSCSYPKIGILVTIMRKGPLPLSTIADLHSYSRQNLTTLTDRLEADGLVRRVPDAKDRRIINLEITEAGRRHVHDRGEHLKQELLKELELMDDAEIKALRDSFETIARLYLEIAEPQKKNDYI